MSSSLPVTVSHVAERYQCYPGETVRLHTRVTPLAALTSFTLTVTLPNALTLAGYRAVSNGMSGALTVADGLQVITWTEQGEIVAGRCLDYLIEATIDADQLDWQTPGQPGIAPLDHDPADAATVLHDRLTLTSQASVIYTSDSEAAAATSTTGPGFQAETTYITVPAKGRYLQYLPALYEQDELMGRFLMLFESFWEPVERQLAQIHHVFDPALTPNALLPWLAAWYDLPVGAEWSETQQRAILAAVMHLYRRRGARQGLQTTIQRFCGGCVKLSESTAGSFHIGRDAQLGSGIAFGVANAPHTFTVHITAPQLTNRWEGPITDEVRTARIAQLKTLLTALIEAEKPAHTVCRALIIE